MSWAVGFDTRWNRDIGYGVPVYCDQPECMAEIDRGLAYVCGGEPYGGESSCGLYFCGSHLHFGHDGHQICERCWSAEDPFSPTPDHPTWINHKLTDDSWAEWRKENAAKEHP